MIVSLGQIPIGVRFLSFKKIDFEKKKNYQE